MADTFKKIYESIKREVQYHRFINESHIVRDMEKAPNARIYGNIKCYTCNKYIILKDEPYAFTGNHQLGWRLFCSKACYDRYLDEMREIVIETHS
jgi:hypothetical protein